MEFVINSIKNIMYAKLGQKKCLTNHLISRNYGRQTYRFDLHSADLEAFVQSTYPPLMCTLDVQI
jgi:hypothetical protein